ncbi:SusC/RagA family TonB-linked outer membrane protein [Sphingobacterium tabacisoli]|uniref:SusC/RagA family TonB-linked outer membrane protein n=1 Tax=Sphingobacterium tabacisoli TaxID=2044855 RepID=A0ABW5L5I5_9SPHI|nr:SusC/RagA family TonB-linked outer membrane protein [Sphingobacterium tabacisoli]
MKLTSVLFLFSMLGAMAKTNAQKINLDLKKVSFRKAFLEITKQTGVTFIYLDKDVNPNWRVDLSVSNKEVKEVVPLLLKGRPLQYTLSGKSVSIVPMIPAMPLTTKKTEPVEDVLQSVIRGRVVNEKGDVLVGATISVEGKKTGAVTDANGHFTLQNVAENETLIVSYVGYISQTIQGRANVGTIILKTKDGNIGEAVVRINTGYQRLPKERMTGSFSYISGEQLESKLTTGIKNALEGQAAGVVIDKSGNIEIRGISTFNAQKTPLLVVDGYPIDGGIDDVNPMNIASITVLKDGVAASIYGSRAANGVIVVTTKMGLSGKPKVKYSSFVNIIGRPQLKYLNRATTSDYIDAEVDLFNYDVNNASPIDQYNMSRVTYLLMQARDGEITEEAAMAEIEGLKKIDGMGQIEKAFFRNEISHQHNVGITGGTEEYNYNVAINYQNTQQNMLNNDNKRFIFDLKNEWKPLSFLTLGAAANLTLNKANSSWMLVNTIYGPEYQGMHFSTITDFNTESMLQPYTQLWDEAGNQLPLWGLSQYKIDAYKNTPGMKSWDYHPIDELNRRKFTRNGFSTRISGFVRADLLEGLTAEFGGNWERGSRQVKGIQDADSYDVRIAYNDATSKTNYANHYFPDGGVINEHRDFNESWTLRSQLNYSKDFAGNRHRVNALIGNEMRKITFDRNELATRLGYNPTAGSFIPVNIKDYNARVYNSDMLMNPVFKGITDGAFNYSDNRFVSWYANGSYEYDDRFILSGSMRLDLTNFFGTDKKFRYKPLWSLGGTYKLSKEKFWNSEVVNKLHVRGSYGINGNISLNNGPYLILKAYNYLPKMGGIPYYVESPPNNQLRWEKTGIVNFGIDFGLFNNRIEGTLDYYNKRSEDLLAEDAVDQTVGYTSVVRNVGEMSNEGLELSMNINVIDQKDWKWIVSPNVAFNSNTVHHYNVTRPYTSYYTDAMGILIEGSPADALFGYRFAGLNNRGQTQVYNRNNEKVLIANAEIPDLIYQGTFRPKWDLALTNRVKYQDFNLSFMFVAKLGHKYRKDAFLGSNIRNRHVGERWRKPGDEANTIYPVLQDWNMDMFDFPYIDKLVGNASYAKLRDVTLSYDLSKFTQRFKIANAQVYVQGRNLLLITAKGVDIDPETAEVNDTGGVSSTSEQGFTSLPRPREMFIGLRVNF